MLKALKNEANKTYTENGAVSNRTTGKDCLDLSVFHKPFLFVCIARLIRARCHAQPTYPAGSTREPLMNTSRWQWTPVALPVIPRYPIVWPCDTTAP